MAKAYVLDRTGVNPVMDEVPTEKIPIYADETAATAALSNLNVGDILATRDITEADVLGNLITKVDALEAGNVYSTSEVNTGKTWIDGKPIYRKCITGSQLQGTRLQAYTDMLRLHRRTTPFSLQRRTHRPPHSRKA